MLGTVVTLDAGFRRHDDYIVDADLAGAHSHRDADYIVNADFRSRPLRRHYQSVDADFHEPIIAP